MCGFTAVDLRLYTDCPQHPLATTSSIEMSGNRAKLMQELDICIGEPYHRLAMLCSPHTSCDIEMVASWTSSDHTLKRVQNFATIIDNKDTNIWHRYWSERHPVLPDETLRLLEAYPTASS
jgi:hypothetical protein